MRVTNQYTEDIEQFRRETGKDPYIEYKSATPERKKEIEDWFFNVLRSKNTVPEVEFSYGQQMEELIRLSEVRKEELFKDGDYWFNTAGVNFLYPFFPELNDVAKGNGKDHPGINDYFKDDSKLRRAIRKNLEYSTTELDLYRWMRLAGAGYCSNFRPATAKTLYEVYGPDHDCHVLDTSSGYGARMLGAHFAENVTEYVGIDPNTAPSCNKLAEWLDREISTNTQKQVLQMGSEDFTRDAFPQYQSYFDLYFTSPPYFNTERYSQSDTQSYKKYPTYAGWIKGFYRDTIYNACDALKANGVFGMNIFFYAKNEIFT